MTYAILMTLLAGASTGLGALAAFFRKTKRTIDLSIALGFSAGVMVYISFMELLPSALKGSPGKEGEFWVLVWFFGGFALAFVIDQLVPEDVNPHELKSQTQVAEFQKDISGGTKPSLRRTGFFTALVLAVHNFPEGFAVFFTSIQETESSLAIVLAVAIHNIPEGIAVAFPIYYATGSRRAALFAAFASGMAEPLGAMAGYFILIPIFGDFSLGSVYALVSGIMIYISFDELLPSARVYGNAHTTIFGILGGMVVTAAGLLLL